MATPEEIHAKYGTDPNWRVGDAQPAAAPSAAAPAASGLSVTDQRAEDYNTGQLGIHEQYGTDPDWRSAIRAPEQERDYDTGIGYAFMRGLERLRAMPDVAQGDYDELADHYGSMDKWRMSDDDIAIFEDMRNQEGWWKKAGKLMTNPRLVVQVVAESLPMMAAPIVGGIAGGVGGGAVAGPPGAFVGAMAGGGIGSYFTEYYASMGEYFSEQGVDMTNAQQLKAAFEDPELMAGARSFSQARGIPIAIFDALSMGLAGRVAAPARGLQKAVTGTQRFGGTAAEILTQGAFGSAGEAGAQIASTGQVEDQLDVILEGVAEFVPGLAEASVMSYVDRKARAREKGLGDPNDSPLAALDQPDAEPTELDADRGKVVSIGGNYTADELDKAFESTLADLDATIEAERPYKDQAERQALDKDASDKQKRDDIERMYADETDRIIAEATGAALESEMVTPTGLPVEGEPVDVSGGIESDTGQILPAGVNPVGGRPLTTNLGEALRGAGVQQPPPTGSAPGSGLPTPSGSQGAKDSAYNAYRLYAVDQGHADPDGFATTELQKGQDEANALGSPMHITGHDTGGINRSGQPLTEQQTAEGWATLGRIDPQTPAAGPDARPGEGLLSEALAAEVDPVALENQLETEEERAAIQEADQPFVDDYDDSIPYESIKGQPVPAVEWSDPRLADKAAHEGLDRMASETVKGGGVTLVESDEIGVTYSGRTPSENPPWVLAIISEEGVGRKDILNAVEKAKAGKRLGVRQKRIIEAMLDEWEAPTLFNSPEEAAMGENRPAAPEPKPEAPAFELEQEQDGVVAPEPVQPAQPRQQVSADIGVPGDMFSPGANAQVDLVDEVRADKRKKGEAPAGLKLRESKPSELNALVEETEALIEKFIEKGETDGGMDTTAIVGAIRKLQLNNHPRAADLEAIARDAIEGRGTKSLAKMEEGETLTDNEAAEVESADHVKYIRRLRDSGKTRRGMGGIAAEIEANLTTMGNNGFGHMGRDAMITGFRQLKEGDYSTADYDALLERVTNKLLFQPVRTGFLDDLSTGNAVNSIVADVEEQHEAWRQIRIADDKMSWSDTLSQDDIDANNVRIDRLAEMGDPRAFELVKDMDHWMHKDRISAKSSDPRFKKARKANKIGFVEGIRNREAISFEASQMGYTVSYDSLTFTTPEDQARMDRILAVGEQDAGGTTPPGTPPTTPPTDFVIDEKKFDEWGTGTEERVFNSTVDKKKRKAIDTKLKGAPYISMEEADTIVTEWEEHAMDQRQQSSGSPQDHKDNFNRVILSLFDTSGTWANPYALAGYDVRVIDIKNGVDIQDFSSEYLEELFDSFGGKDVYGVIAACPCTTFSNSGTRWREARHDNTDPVESRKIIEEMWGKKAAEAKNDDGTWMYASANDYGNELVAQTMRTLEYYRPQFWALENPEGRIQTSAGLPDWRTAFQPNNFGEPYTKRTVLFGEFNEDLPSANVEPTEGSKMHKMSPSEDRAAARAETPVGFSYAFFMANNYLDADPLARTKADYWYAAGAIEEAFRAGVTEDQIRDRVDVDSDYEGSDRESALDAIRGLIEEVTSGAPTPTPTPTTEPSGLHKTTETSIRSKSVTQLSKQDKTDLQAYAIRLGLEEGGTKVELARRIKEAVGEAPAPPVAPDEFVPTSKLASTVGMFVDTPNSIPDDAMMKRFRALAKKNPELAPVADFLKQVSTLTDKAETLEGNAKYRFFEDELAKIPEEQRNLYQDVLTRMMRFDDMVRDFRDMGVNKAEAETLAMEQMGLGQIAAVALPTEVEMNTIAGEADPVGASDAQKDAGNYKKGHMTLAGLDVTIENPVGTVRHGNLKLKDHYGYIKRTEGADGDQVDVFVNPKAKEDWQGDVYVVDQAFESVGGFDEHKVMFGYNNLIDARRAYKRNYNKDWAGGKAITKMTQAEFKAWLAEPGANKLPASLSKVTEAGKKARAAYDKGLRYAVGKDLFNSPSEEWTDKVLNPRTAEGHPVVGDIADTMPMNVAVSELLRMEAERLSTPTKSAATKFGEWFGDSKVVNDEGAPLVVYHGTDQGFETFDPAAQGGNTGAPSAKEAFFFTDRVQTAEYYSRGQSPNMQASWRRAKNEGTPGPSIKQVYLSMQNPLVEDFKGKVYRETTYAELIERAKAAGHDGVIMENTYDAGEYSKTDAILMGRFGGETVYAVFDAAQIKTTDQLKSETTPTPRAPSFEAISGAIKPLENMLPGAPVTLLHNYKQAPRAVSAAMFAQGKTQVKAVFDPTTNEIFMFADQIGSIDEAVRTSLHEKAHRGLRVAFGDRLNPLLDDIYKNANDVRQVNMNNIAERYKLDSNTKEDQRIIAEELLAHMAEHDVRDGMVNRAVAFVRKLLRDMGVTLEFTDNDIRALIREAQGAVSRKQPTSTKPVMLEEEVTVEGSEEVYIVEQDADVVLTGINQRIEMCGKLRACL
jgi:hypothetical protein